MIKTGIKLELYRAFHNFYYLLALLLGCAIAILHFVMQVIPKTRCIGVFQNIDYPYSVFNSCLPLDMGCFHLYLFYFAVILLGTIPFGMSYYTDLREGYIKNIYTRMEHNGYLIGKYLAVFLSAGSVCVIPLCLNIALTMAVLPSLIPQQGTAMFALAGSCMLSGFFYSHPFAYLGVYLIIDFTITGLFACMGLVVAKIIYNRYVVLFTPFVLFFVMQTVFMYTPIASAGPYYIMNPCQQQWQQTPIVITEIVLLFLVSFGTFYLMGGKKHDTL